MSRGQGDFSRSTVELIWEREQGRCALCGDPVTGERGFDYSVHHRKPKGMGGGKNAPWLGTAANGLLVHGHGTDGCHGDIEKNRTSALYDGFLINRNSIIMPADVPIRHALHGWVLLDEEGWFTSVEDPSQQPF